MTVITSILAFLVAIAILIAVHEFGHFIVARLLGVKVLRYSIGFGRVLLSWRPRGETEYAISAIPLGGYVKLLDEREGEVPAEERHRAFNRQPTWSRAAILAAGPAFNFLFALIAYWIVYMVGIPGVKPIVGHVAPHTPAAVAGMQEKDTILAVNGASTSTWQSTRLALLSAVMDKKPLKLRVRPARSSEEKVLSLPYGNIKQLTRPGKLLSGLGLTPWQPRLPVFLASVNKGGAAARAGLQAGDRILAIDGEAVRNTDALAAGIRKKPGQQITLTVERGQKRLKVPVVPETRHEHGKPVGLIGVKVYTPARYRKQYAEQFLAYTRFDPAGAFGHALARTGQIIALTAVASYRMLIGEVSLSNLNGPISIAQYAGSWARAGALQFLYFLALISVSLGFVNILPIPLLDGGQLLFLGIEAVQRRPLSEQAEAVGQRVGLSLILLLVGFAVFNDLRRLFHS